MYVKQFASAYPLEGTWRTRVFFSYNKHMKLKWILDTDISDTV